MEIEENASRGTAGIARRTFVVCASVLVAGSFVSLPGCAQQEEASEAPKEQDANRAGETVDVRIGALKGPTGMGLAGMMGSAPSGTSEGNAYSFELAGSADELTPMLVQGDLDICMVPANLAAVLSQKTEGAVQVLSVNTLGVLDIVCVDESIRDMTDLADRTIVSAGKGSTPEYALRYLLECNGIDPDSDVAIEWKSEHVECLAALEADPAVVAMLPQPFATSALSKVAGARIAIDLNDAWDEVAQAMGSEAQLVTGVAVVRSEFAEQHPEAIAMFMDDYASSVAYVNENVEDAAQAIEDAGIIDAAVASKAIPFCNIVFISGEEMKASLSGYLQTLYDAAPESVGGSMPDDEFYYLG